LEKNINLVGLRLSGAVSVQLFWFDDFQIKNTCIYCFKLKFLPPEDERYLTKIIWCLINDKMVLLGV